MMPFSAPRITVLGGGSWGTALAALLADNGHAVCLWSRNRQVVEDVNDRCQNLLYLPDAPLPPGIRATTSLADALVCAGALIFAVPSQSVRPVAQQVAEKWKEHPPSIPRALHAAKGLEQGSAKRMSEVLQEELGVSVCALSGPSHAEEVIRRFPTTVSIAGNKQEDVEWFQQVLTNPYFRAYACPDLIGAELGGALKNVIALAAGLSDGLGYGDNTKAALLTRGLAEMVRVGCALGAQSSTFYGLSGLGDLLVTGTSPHSRNWKTGYMLGQGLPLAEALASLGMVAEGVKTAPTVYEWGRAYGLDLPITRSVYGILQGDLTPKDASTALMTRSVQGE